MKILNDKALCRYASSGGPSDKEGYLMKKGEVNKGFQRRWFVLKGNLLFYYEKKGDREPLGVIVLEGCTIELAENSDNFTFQINFLGSSSRTYIISGETQELMESWMKALSAAGYEYVKLMVSELQQKLREANSEEQRKVVEEAERQSRILSQTYIERQGLEVKGNRQAVVCGDKRTNPFNQRLSSGSEWESCDLFNVMESGAPGPYSPHTSWAQKPPRSFVDMHEEILQQVEKLGKEWRKRQANILDEKKMNGQIGSLGPLS
ncbi:sesquipedalian-1-like [Haliotis cracherodii]|uniref:sesquipedalian-1-like n=1 Tax=Haliotis cracherodii TaxID=6455 RepID=UPI0039E9CAAD